MTTPSSSSSKFLPLSRWAKIICVILVIGLAYTLTNGAAANINFDFNAPANEGGTNIIDGLNTVTQYIYYVFYLLGAIFLGVGAFKLKQGDMGGFAKNIAGGITLFFIPAAIKLFRSLGATAAAG